MSSPQPLPMREGELATRQIDLPATWFRNACTFIERTDEATSTGAGEVARGRPREGVEERQVAVQAVAVGEDPLGEEGLLVPAAALDVPARAKCLDDGERAEPHGLVARGVRRRGTSTATESPRGVAAAVRVEASRRSSAAKSR